MLKHSPLFEFMRQGYLILQTPFAHPANACASAHTMPILLLKLRFECKSRLEVPYPEAEDKFILMNHLGQIKNYRDLDTTFSVSASFS